MAYHNIGYCSKKVGKVGRIKDVELAVVRGLDRYKNQYGNRERREVKRLSHNLDPELKGGSGSNSNSVND